MATATKKLGPLEYPIKEILPNGDVVVDGTGLYRILYKGETTEDLVDEERVKHVLDFFNEPPKLGGYSAVSYAELAKQ